LMVKSHFGFAKAQFIGDVEFGRQFAQVTFAG